ncbi:hypothetical protein DCAR_0209603 [Daucus carota subsp. sativus]|uniref:Uncharacterized protein n=1 Tax=Daucus carota subsp. sativus TaxID=79200 RepID=A0A166FDY7_DAUCS|nr:hypothetical protein DCAR_0209603 [Daucus carota subsp. sativus]
MTLWCTGTVWYACLRFKHWGAECHINDKDLSGSDSVEMEEELLWLVIVDHNLMQKW